MADSISDADKVVLPPSNPDSPGSKEKQIRNKRLAKLGAQNSVQATPAPPEPAYPPSRASPEQIPTAQDASRAKIDMSSTSNSSETSQKPFVQSTQKQANAEPPRINISSIGGSQNASLKRSRPSPSAGKPIGEESLESWEDKTLAGIFRLTLDKGQRQDYLGHRLHYVDGVRRDLEEEKAPIRLSVGVLDQALLEAASVMGKQSPLDYLLACWKRVTRQFKTLKAKPDNQKLGVIREARRLCMSYCIFAITMPEMFGREPAESSLLTPHLLVDQEDDRGLCHDFLLEMVSRFAEDDSAQEAMVRAVEDLSRQLARMTMNDDYKPYILVSQQEALRTSSTLILIYLRLYAI